MRTLIFALSLMTASATAQTIQTPPLQPQEEKLPDVPARQPLYPGCVVMAVIDKEVCPVHHGRVSAYEVLSYDAEGTYTRIYSQKEWPAESTHLLKLTKLILELHEAKVKLAQMEAARAKDQAKAASPAERP